jgi:copper chaperone CopZ
MEPQLNQNIVAKMLKHMDDHNTNQTNFDAHKDAGNSQINAMVALISVKGMSCSSCGDRIQKRLETLDGVLLTEVSYSYKLAVVVYDNLLVSPEQFKFSVLEDVSNNYQISIISTVPALDYWWQYITD